MDGRNKHKVTKKDKNLVKNGYEAIMIIEDLLLDATDENTIEKLKILRKDVRKLAYINKQINTKEGN